MDGDQLLSILHGLENNNLLADAGYLLTGYIGSESFLRSILIIVEKLRQNAQEGKLETKDYFLTSDLIFERSFFLSAICM